MDVENKENEQIFNNNYNAQAPGQKFQQNIKEKQSIIRPKNTLINKKEIQNDIEKQKEDKIILLDDDLDHPIALESDFYDEGNERKEDIRNNFIKNKLKERMKKEKEKNIEAYEVALISAKMVGQLKKDIQIEEEIRPIISNDIPINKINSNVDDRNLDIKEDKRNGLAMNIISEDLLNLKMNNGKNTKNINGNNIIKKSENGKQINIQKSQKYPKLENRIQNKQQPNQKNITINPKPITNTIEIKPKFINSKNDIEMEKEKENQLNNNIQQSINLENKTERINNKSVNKIKAKYIKNEKSYKTISQIPPNKVLKKNVKPTNNITKIISINPVNNTQEIDKLKHNKQNIKEINNNFNKNQNLSTNYCTCFTNNNNKNNKNCQISTKGKIPSDNLDKNRLYIDIQNDNIHNHNYSINENIPQKELPKDKTIKAKSNLSQFISPSKIKKPTTKNM